jgi:hypothetical protein
MQPTIRLTDYVAEYQKLVYDDYAEWNNIILATYYKIDSENTVYDENYIDTYRVTGEKSGRKWNKIHLLPVGFIQQVMPNISSSEYGVGFSNDVETAITIDSSVNLTPAVGDILHFEIDGNYAYWHISNIERSGPLQKAFYRCTVEQVRPRKNWEIYNIQDEYIFIEYLKSILPIVQGYNFTKLLSRVKSLISYLNNDLYNANVCSRINPNGNSYPEIDFILNSYDTIIPPNMTLLTEKYVNNIPDNSVLTLLFLPNLFNSAHTINYIFKKVSINPRIQLFNLYKEYISDSSGDLNILTDFYGDYDQYMKNFLQEYKDCLFNSSLDVTVNEDIAMTKLLKEFLDFLRMTSPIDELNETLTEKISTNLLEAAVEFCLISRKLHALSEISIMF